MLPFYFEHKFFVAFVKAIMPLRVQYGILKTMYCILCKTEGNRPYYTHYSTINKCFDSTQIYN